MGDDQMEDGIAGGTTRHHRPRRQSFAAVNRKCKKVQNRHCVKWVAARRSTLVTTVGYVAMERRDKKVMDLYAA